MRKIYIGTSGWSYKDWKETFYPTSIKPNEYLKFYAQHFPATEINTSFYHLPKQETVSNWVQAVPAKFMFCPKLSRYATHIKKLREPENTLPSFFEAIEPLKKHCGPILIQLPPSLKFQEDIANIFFQYLHQHFSFYKYALEIRHNSWLEKNSLQLMKHYKIALVMAHSGGKYSYTEIITARHVYMRFHGPNGNYNSSYRKKQLQYFANKIKNFATSHTVWAFFNNDGKGYAVKNAYTLIDLIKKS
jgi:uncharacterized protein YecE (DUF72 family)